MSALPDWVRGGLSRLGIGSRKRVPFEMPELSEETLRVLERIERAFADVPMPPPSELTPHSCGECDEINAVFAGEHWRDYLCHPYELLGYFAPREPRTKVGRDFIPLLSPSAIYFFLPIFLAAILIDEREADLLTDSIPDLFDPGPKPGKPETWNWREERSRTLLESMTPEQREAVIDALQLFPGEHEFDLENPPTLGDAIENLEVGSPIAWRKHQPPRRS